MRTGIRALLLLLLAVGAWLVLVPSQFGGFTTYALVTGRSMEPTLHDGTLVVAHQHAEYTVGDVIVYEMYGGHVMHRIVGGSPEYGFTTRGDNVSFNDPWKVSEDQILGEVLFTVPAAGTALVWVAKNPVATAAVAALLVLMSYIPRHRRRVTPALAAALEQASDEPAPPPAPQSLRLALVVGNAMSVLCLIAAVVALTTHARLWPTMVLALGALIACAIGTEYLAALVYDGRGQPGPAHAAAALAGRVRRFVAPIPDGEAFTPEREPRFVRTPERLRDVASSYRVPVLHRVDPATGDEDYLAVTPRADYVWHDVRPAHEAADR